MRDKLPILFLRIMTILAAMFGVFVSIVILPSFGTAIARNMSEYSFTQYPILIGLYAAAACFFFALFQFWLLLNGIDRDKTLPAKQLKLIKFSAIVFCALYFLAAMPVIFLAAQADDAPGVILVGAFLGALPLGVAAVAATLEQIGKSRENGA